jgi:DNA-binding PucR family transcriptional regulator
VADVRALDAVAAAHPWALGTLDAVIRHLTVRKAATELHVHHSTLQERIVHLRRELGFDVDSPTGRQRAALALVLRRLRNSGALIGG